VKTLKVSPVNRHPVLQSRLANRHASRSGKPLGSVAYLDGVQAQMFELRATQTETEKELRLRTLMPSILDKAFKGEL